MSPMPSMKDEGKRPLPSPRFYARRPASLAGKTVEDQIQLDQFAKRLRSLRIARGMSQSDLAREIWGETENSARRKVAKNRDRISVYEKGTGWPDPPNLLALATALHVTVEELAPELVSASAERSNPDFAITAAPGSGAFVYLKLNKRVPFGVAAKITAILAEEKLTEPEDDDDK